MVEKLPSNITCLGAVVFKILVKKIPQQNSLVLTICMVTHSVPVSIVDRVWWFNQLRSTPIIPSKHKLAVTHKHSRVVDVTSVRGEHDQTVTSGSLHLNLHFQTDGENTQKDQPFMISNNNNNTNLLICVAPIPQVFLVKNGETSKPRNKLFTTHFLLYFWSNCGNSNRVSSVIPNCWAPTSSASCCPAPATLGRAQVLDLGVFIGVVGMVARVKSAPVVLDEASVGTRDPIGQLLRLALLSEMIWSEKLMALLTRGKYFKIMALLRVCHLIIIN